MDINFLKSDRDIEIIQTKTGEKTLCVNNVLLHSKYDPVKEAKNYLDYNKHIYENKKLVVIYGLGFGYYIKELLNRVDKQCKIYIFDIDKEIVTIAKDLKIIDDIIKDKRVELLIGYSEAFFKKFIEKINEVDDVLFMNQMLKVLPEEYAEFKEAIKTFELGKIAIQRFGPLMDENNKLNMQVNSESIDKFFMDNNENKPVVVVAAGPSLNLCIEALKKLKSKVKIFAVARALKILIEHDIKPDMICAIDPQEVVYTNQIKGYEHLDIPFCFLNTTCNLAVKNYKGPKYMFYNEDTIYGTKINTGKSVATAVLDIAIKTKANPIIFVGQDLAYINGITHSQLPGVVIENSFNVDNHKKTKGVNGEMLQTTEGLLVFKRWIEATIQKHPEITFINCSSGAKINGTIEMELSSIEGYIKS